MEDEVNCASDGREYHIDQLRAHLLGARKKVLIDTLKWHNPQLPMFTMKFHAYLHRKVFGKYLTRRTCKFKRLYILSILA
jgi:hypothetical protein